MEMGRGEEGRGGTTVITGLGFVHDLYINICKCPMIDYFPL